jgi:hypothetical protein
MAAQRPMTEARWHRTGRYNQLLDFLGVRLTRRKQILFGCGCARQLWHLLTHEVNRQAVQTSERHADGRARKAEMRRAWGAIEWEPVMYTEWPIDMVTAWVPYRDITWNEAHEKGLDDERQRPEAVRERGWSDVIRELFGNPFRPVEAVPQWLTGNDGTAAKLAQTIYDEYAFDRLPILGDALEDAGCDNVRLLAHCRQRGPHYRGCWALDLILGKD